GRPVSGGIVRPPAYKVLAGVDGGKTAADGTFALAFSGLHPYVRGLVVELDGGSRVGLARFPESLSYSRNRNSIRIVVKPTRLVNVHVKDATGKPVVGAAVTAAELTYQTVSNTNIDGIATLRVAADARILWVIGLKPGVGFDYFENYRSDPPRDVLNLPEK